jgi:hypothetical protein
MARWLSLIACLATLLGCGTLSQEGATDRLKNLIKYTTPQKLGPAYYNPEHYEDPDPVRQIHRELQASR